MSTLNPGASTLMQRMWLALRAGLSFKGNRDYYEIFGYNRNLTPADLMAKFDRQDIAQRVANSAPEAVWAYPPSLEGVGDAQVLWGKLLERQVLPTLLQADKLCAFDTFSVLWLGMPGSVTTAASPKSLDDIVYITAHGAGTVTISRYESDTSSPRFGMPLIYDIRIDQQQVPASSAITRSVHWSRVVHLTDIPVQGRLFSAPRLLGVYNLLDDIMKVAGSAAETYWLAANRGLQVDVDKDMQFQKGDAEKLSDELDEYQHQLRRFIRTRGVKINNLGSDGVDPSGVFTTLMALLASTTNIPQRILMGAEAGQLASAQDRANWAEFIERRRTLVAEPYMLYPFFKHLEMLGLLAKGLADKIKYIWPEAFHQNPLEESQTMSAKARALINLSRQSQYGTPYVGMKEGRVWLGLPPELPSNDTLPMAKEVKGSKKVGGSTTTGGAGGNDGSGDSGGGAAQTEQTPRSDGTGDPTGD